MSLFLIVNLVLTSTSYAQNETVTSSTQPVQKTKLQNINQTTFEVLNSPITGQVIDQLGEPGFYISKFLNYRKQITQPTCTLSEQINKFSILTAVTGELTIHAFDYFALLKLNKQFDQKIEQINKYKAQMKEDKKNLLDFDSASPNIQIDSLKYLQSMAQIELKRAEVVRIFSYTTLGMQLTSKILASLEGTAEISSLGASSSAQAACKVAKQAQTLADESKVDAILSPSKNSQVPAQSSLQNFAANKTLPRFLAPFQSLAEKASILEVKVNQIEGSKTVKTITSYTHGYRVENAISDAKDANTGLSASKFIEVAHSAAYAEDMMVNVAMEVIKKWEEDKSRDVRKEINQFNESSNKDNGIMNFIKKLGADEMAIRFAIRSLVKSNILQVNAFMKSGFGRFVVFTYNVYQTYRSIEVNEAQIKYAKQKIEILDKSISDFQAQTKTTWIPSFKKYFNFLVSTSAYAAPLPLNEFPMPPCHKGILQNCSAAKVNLLLMSDMKSFQGLSKKNQEEQVKLVSGNYSLKSTLKLATGKISYEDIDLEKIKNEIKTLEKYSDHLEKDHPRNNPYVAKKESIIQNLKNQIIFPSELIASYKNSKSTGMGDALFSKNAGTKFNANISDTDSNLEKTKSKTTLTVAPSSIQMINKNYDFKSNTIHSKEINLFQIISEKYLQYYKRQEVIQ